MRGTAGTSNSIGSRLASQKKAQAEARWGFQKIQDPNVDPKNRSEVSGPSTCKQHPVTNKQKHATKHGPCLWEGRDASKMKSKIPNQPGSHKQNKQRQMPTVSESTLPIAEMSALLGFFLFLDLTERNSLRQRQTAPSSQLNDLDS